jgi:predicted DNA binding CopG/RHH family protein
MTSKNLNGKLKRVNLRLWEADLAYLKERFPDNYNAQIRRIVGNWVTRRHGTRSAD